MWNYVRTLCLAFLTMVSIAINAMSLNDAPAEAEYGEVWRLLSQLLFGTPTDEADTRALPETEDCE